MRYLFNVCVGICLMLLGEPLQRVAPRRQRRTVRWRTIYRCVFSARLCDRANVCPCEHRRYVHGLSVCRAPSLTGPGINIKAVVEFSA